MTGVFDIDCRAGALPGGRVSTGRFRKISLCFALLAARLAGQTTDTSLFRVLLLPANEVPAVNSTARGVADIAANVMRDSSGQIVSGSLDILLRTTLPAAVTATGLNLHNAVSGKRRWWRFRAALRHRIPAHCRAGRTRCGSRPSSDRRTRRG
jgi:hypothetical protein